MAPLPEVVIGLVPILRPFGEASSFLKKQTKLGTKHSFHRVGAGEPGLRPSISASSPCSEGKSASFLWATVSGL